MPFLSIFFAALLIFTGAAITTLTRDQATAQEVENTVSAAKIRIQADIIKAFMTANPLKDGLITNSELTPYIPSWYKLDNQIKAVGSKGKGYLFLTPKQGSRLSIDTVFDEDVPVSIGIANNGKLITPYAGAISYEIPSSIPNGSLVYVI